MQISTVYFLTAAIAVLPGALAGMCKPPPPPPPPPSSSPVYTPMPEPVSTPPVYPTPPVYSPPPPVYSSSAAPVSTPPVTPPPAYICDGDLKCCTMPLQGNNVAAYCTDGNMPETGCGAMYTICCSKDAEKALTPRGYTYVGCTTPDIKTYRM